MDIQEIECGVGSIYLVQFRDSLWAVVNTAWTFVFKKKWWKFLIGCETVRFARKTVLRGVVGRKNSV